MSGVSGTGHVADGVMFPDGTCVIRWRTMFSSTAIYNNLDTLLNIHGHEGATGIEWVDDA